MIYKVNENYKGAVAIGDRSYQATQIIKDDGNPRVSRNIERLLKLEESPITLVTDRMTDSLGSPHKGLVRMSSVAVEDNKKVPDSPAIPPNDPPARKGGK